MRAIALLLVLLPACEWGVATFDCVDDGIDEALQEASERWPDTARVGRRLDVFCMPVAEVQDWQHCGRSKAREPTSCMQKVGSLFSRARMFASHGVSARAQVLHEMQHAHLWDHPDACQSHEASCGWEEP